jgi:hypothetical protein
MKQFSEILLILIIACNWVVYPLQAYSSYKHNCLCCKKTICTRDANCNGSDQSIDNPGHNAKRNHCNFKPCNDCKQKQNTEVTFLMTESTSQLRKKPVLFVSQTILPNNTLVLGANTEASLYNQHLLSSSSLFLLNESLRL